LSGSHVRVAGATPSQIVTDAASGEEFCDQLAALQERLKAAHDDLEVQRRVVATMRSLVLEASRALFDLPRLETAVREAVVREAEVRDEMEQLREEMEAQRLALEAIMARQIQEAVRAAEVKWTAAVASERTARETAIRDEAAARASAVAHIPGMLSWFKSRATSETAGYTAFAEAAGWRPYPKDAALSAAEDAGLKHGGAIADDAITRSSERAPELGGGKLITCPLHMCPLGQANSDNGLNVSVSFCAIRSRCCQRARVGAGAPGGRRRGGGVCVRGGDGRLRDCRHKLQVVLEGHRLPGVHGRSHLDRRGWRRGVHRQPRHLDARGR
jgi:hypothetical protein